MKAKKILGILLVIPLTLIVLGSFGASIYAAYAKIAGITYASSVIIGIAIVLFLAGIFLLKKEKESKNETKNEIKSG